MASPIQVKTATSIGTANLSVTLTSTGSGHSLIIYVLSFAFGSTNNTVSSIALGATSDTISKAVSFNGTTNSPDFEIWHDLTASSGQTTLTVTFNAGNAGNLNIVQVEEWTKLSAVDKMNSNSNSGQTTFSAGGTGTLSQASELVVGAVAGKSATSAFTFTGPSSPWTNESQVSFNSGSENIAMLSGYNTVSSTASVDYTGSISPGENYSALIASYEFPGVLVNIPVVQTTDNVPALSPTTNVGLVRVQTTSNVPSVTPAIPVLVNLPTVRTRSNVPSLQPQQPSVLVASIVGTGVPDPILGIFCPLGFTNFNALSSANQVNMGNTQLTFNPSVGVSGAAGIAGNTTGELILSSGIETGGDTASQLILESAARSVTANGVVDVAASNLQVNGTNMNVP